ncbi:MAG: ATP-binding protein [Planctomycetaceae bacterium]
MECPSCGAPTPADARFCSSCGAALAPAAPGREERKIISVLFVDLVGFTARSDGADPEDVRDSLEGYFASVRGAVERYGGTVEKFIGDAVMAVFGAPVAHTDDAERAVRAGLAALEAVSGLGLSARAAVNTGEAVVSVGSGHERGEALALGDVVNTASRLQSSAPTGGLVVGEETYRATHDAIRYEERPPVTAKGKRDPLAIWLAQEALAAPSERQQRSIPMVGRERELTLLRSMWDGAFASRRPQLVTVLGPAGIGKSRLWREFGRLVEAEGARVIRGRCLPYDTHDLYEAFGHQLRQIAGIYEQDPPQVARAKLGETVASLFDEAERGDILRSLSLLLGLGLDEPVEEQLLLLFAARRLVERLGGDRPTLLVFEDVHWADTAELELIEYLVAHAHETPVLFLAVARPEFLDAHPTWGSGLPTHSAISLEPVSPHDAARIVEALVGTELPPTSLGRLVDVAEGNPLFLEELTSALLEGCDPRTELPTSIRTVIAARVDALPAPHREALLAASVIGKVFWADVLRALGQDQRLLEILDDLEAKDLIRREPVTQVQGDLQFSFKHILIRDVCYATLPRAARRAAHEAVARHIERAAGQDRELAWLLAHHWQEAGDTARAVDYLLLAAERAEEALAVDQALDLFGRAQAIAPDDATRTRVALTQALARVRFGDWDAAADELEWLVPTLDGRDLVEALLALARSYHWTERTSQTLEVAERALAASRDLDADDLEPVALARLSQGYAMRGSDGDLDRALELGERALRSWMPGARREDLVEHEHLLADQHYWTGDYERALELSQRARDEAEDPASAEALLRGGGMAGLMLASMGRYEEAIATCDAAIAIGRELDRSVRVLLNYSTLAFRDLFDLDEARRRTEEALDGQTRTSFHMPWMNAEVDLIATDLLAGELGAAQASWDRLWDEVAATPAWERWLLGGKMAALRAELALQTGDAEGAVDRASEAIAMAEVVHRAKYEAIARATLGKALFGTGRREDAFRELSRGLAVADRLGLPSWRWRIRADIAPVLLAMGDEDGAERELRASGAIVREIAEALSPERAARFLAAPSTAGLLGAV